MKTIHTWTWHTARNDGSNTSIQHPYDLVKHLEQLKKPDLELSLDVLPASQSAVRFTFSIVDTDV
jgi:hypothetical protein